MLMDALLPRRQKGAMNKPRAPEVRAKEIWDISEDKIIWVFPKKLQNLPKIWIRTSLSVEIGPNMNSDVSISMFFFRNFFEPYLSIRMLFLLSKVFKRSSHPPTCACTNSMSVVIRKNVIVWHVHARAAPAGNTLLRAQNIRMFFFLSKISKFVAQTHRCTPLLVHVQIQCPRLSGRMR